MKRIFVGLGPAAALATAAFAAAPAGPPPAAAPLLPARVTQAIQARVAAGEYPALVVAVVNGRQSAVYEFGTLAGGKPPRAGTVFEIGSITKTFTGLLLAEEVEAGTLKLDQPVATLLPGFNLPERDGHQITLQTLATQHSGLPRLPGNFRPADPSNPYADYGPDKLKAFLGGYQLARDPGSAYKYSDLGYGLLGYALAQGAGSTYGALVEQKILAPLGMTASGAELTTAMRAALAPGHRGDGKKAENWSFEALAGAGALKSTGADMLRYLEANMGLLKTPLLGAMRLAQAPLAGGPGGAERVGLGWLIRPARSGEIIWHNGMTGGYASFIGFTADDRRGVVILTNVQQSVDDLGFAVLSSDSPLAPVEKAIALAPKALEPYVGYYLLSPHFVLTVFRDGDQLYAQATGQGAAPIYPSGPDDFFARLADVRIRFMRGGTGGVSGLVLHQNGAHPAPRVTTSDAAEAIGQKIVPLAAATLQSYVGRYQLAPGAIFDITLRGGQLYARLTGQGAYPIFPSAKDHFFYLVVDARIDFVRDTQGQISALVLHQNGGTRRAPRLGG